MYIYAMGTDTCLVRLPYISTFLHVFKNELCTKVGDCLYWSVVKRKRVVYSSNWISF